LAVAKHRGRKSSPRPIRLKCGRCDYEWDYYGRRDRYGTNCPRCQGWVTIPFQFREIPPRKTQAQGQRMRIPSKAGRVPPMPEMRPSMDIHRKIRAGYSGWEACAPADIMPEVPLQDIGAITPH